MALAKTALALLALAALSSGTAAAEEQTLRFKLVVTMVEKTEIDLPAVAGQSLAAYEAVGVAYFEDGHIAFKRYAMATAGGKEDGSYLGLSTYTFENGDALHVKFTGGWSPDGRKVDYTVLSGEGAFEGATGTGELTGLETAWKGASLLEGSFTVEVP